METREYRTIDKSEWGSGPWQEEPDKRQWQDQGTGLPCLIVRGPVGSLCGYVGVSKDHPAHGMDYDEISDKLLPDADYIEAHGGLTYAAGCQHPENEASGICHVPGEGEPDNVWWFGFDCAHYGDYSPSFGRLRDLGRPTGFGEGAVAYRDFAYVEDQIADLAKQIAALVTEPA